MQPKNSIRRKPAFPDGMLIVLGVIILCVIVTGLFLRVNTTVF